MLLDINRIRKLDDLGHIKPRILILSVSPDSAQQYIPLMNCIFSAQKMVCVINNNNNKNKNIILIWYLFFII